MSFSDLLLDICTVERHAQTGTDAYGQPIYSWTNYLTKQACRLVATKGREVKIGAEVVISDWELFLEDIDVTEQDRIAIDGGDTYEILLVQPRADGKGTHHLELILEKVK
jgi:hypothetical protein